MLLDGSHKIHAVTEFMGSYHRKRIAPFGVRLSPPVCLAFFLLLFALVGITHCPLRVEAQTQLSLSRPLRVKWKYETPSTVNLTPAVDRENVYLPLTQGDMVSLRVADGELNWRTETGGDISASPVADERGVYIASEADGPSSAVTPRTTGALRALGRNSGVTLWMRTLPSPIRGVLTSNEKLIFGGASDGRVYAVQKESGLFAWVLKHSAPFFSHPLVHQNRLYLGSEDGSLLAIEQGTGRIAWRYRTQGALRGPVAIVNQTLYFGSADSHVYAVNARDGRLLWRVRAGASIQSVIPTPKGLVVTSLDNFVYFLSLNRGGRLWKRQLAGRIAAQPLTIDDGALFAPLAGDECVILDLREGKKVNSLVVGEDNNTAASPIVAGSLILLTTRQGLFAFSGWTAIEATRT